MSGYLPAASDTNRDEVGETKAAETLPSVPTTLTALLSVLHPQTAVLSPSFLGLESGRTATASKWDGDKCHFLLNIL